MLLLRGHEVVDGERVVERIVMFRLQVSFVRQDGVMLRQEMLRLRGRGGCVIRAQTLSRLHVGHGAFVLGRVGMGRFVAVAALGAAVGSALGVFVPRILAHFLVALEALLPPQIAAVLKHVPGVGVKGPERTFARFIRGPGYFQETVVEGQRVADGVLPALLVLPVKGEKVHYPLIDLAEGQHLAGRLLDGHGYQRNVRVGRLGVRVTPAVGLRVPRSIDVRLAVHGTHGVHVAVRAQAVHGRRLRGHGAHGRAQGCAHSRHTRAHAGHGSRAGGHPRHGGTHARVDIGHVHGVGSHVCGGTHSGHGHISVHRVHSQAGVHVANRGVALRKRTHKKIF